MPLCLVTGGAGFIGSHTVSLLLEKGYAVRILDNLQPRVHPHGTPRYIPREVEFILGDVAAPGDLSRALESVDYVFHLAAYQDYMSDFSRFIHTNAESSALIFEFIVSDRGRYPVKKILFASSQAVSGEGRYVCSACAGGMSVPSIQEQLASRSPFPAAYPISALHIPGPRPLAQLRRGDWEPRCPVCGETMAPLLIREDTISPGTAYGISKYAIELLADRLGRRYGLPTVCMRYSCVQGTRNSLFNAYSGIARRFALQILYGLPPTVYEDGGQLRDYVNVRDVAAANVLAMEDERANDRVFTVGGGRAVTVLEMASMMLNVFESDLEPAMTREFRLGDTRHTVSDSAQLRALGWAPTIRAEHSVAEYVGWIREQSGSKELLDEAERMMRDAGVLRQVE